jgi:ubiquitin thioesterase protein OTUB1
MTFEPLDENEFCRSEVEPCGKEADQVQITALSEALEVGVRIAYLDRSDLGDGNAGEVINWVESGSSDDRPLTLLYRSVCLWFSRPPYRSLG